MKPLFIFEMANNHQGSVEHGKNIIKAIRSVCDKFPEFRFAFKFQYRDLETFIHPDYKNREDIKNVKRFKETGISMEQFEELLAEVRRNDFLAICTPFDEKSVDKIAEQGYDFIKIASCSFCDWPLLEKIAEKKLPVIASGAGSTEEELKNVVHFFTNRGIEFTLMHCVAEYPTANEHLQLNQIDYYHNIFPGIRIGFSTHEDPDNIVPIKIAVSKGAVVFEKHVGLPTDTVSLNAYSANPAQVEKWLMSAQEAYRICGLQGERYHSTEKEKEDLAALKRGVFVKKPLRAGAQIKKEDIFLAFPCVKGQLVAGDLSKYNTIELKEDIQAKNSPVMLGQVEIRNTSEKVLEAVTEVIRLLKDGKIVVPAGSVCELSHHYGIENYRGTGVAMIDCINREYCKKILVLLPGQSHPEHYHIKKEETFIILYGELHIVLGEEKKVLHKGDIITVERGTAHSFRSDTGCIFEEISTTHYANDSYYEQEEEFAAPRKTKIYFTKEMLRAISENG